MINWPTAAEPVKEILATSGLRTSSAPTTSPRPATTLQRPFGRFAACTHSSHTRVCRALISLGFMTTVQPAATAEASFTQRKNAFAFHGLIRPATPTGSRVTVVLPQLRVSGSSCSAFSAARNTSAPDCTIRPANWRTPPYSSTMTSVRSPMRAETALCRLRRISERSSFVVRPKLGNTCLAAAIARRASSSSASVTWAITSPLVGLTMSMTSRPWDATNAPSM